MKAIKDFLHNYSIDRDKLKIVKLSGSADIGGKIVLLLFDDKSTYPIYVIKLLRPGVNSDELKDEFNNLKFIFSKIGKIIGLPLPILFNSTSKPSIYVEAGLPGTLMGSMRGYWINNSLFSTNLLKISLDFSKALNWLANFHYRSIEKSEVLNSDSLKEILIRLSIKKLNLIDTKLESLAENIIDDLVDQLKGQRIPLVCEHGDYWAGNILVDKSQISILDWQNACFNCPPLFDAAFFIISYTLGFVPKKMNPYWVFDEMMNSNSWFYKLATSKLDNYYNILNLNFTDYGPLFSYSLLRRAITEKNRLNSDVRVYQELLQRWQKITL